MIYYVALPLVRVDGGFRKHPAIALLRARSRATGRRSSKASDLPSSSIGVQRMMLTKLLERKASSAVIFETPIFRSRSGYIQETAVSFRPKSRTAAFSVFSAGGRASLRHCGWK
jgi:hypothetical protein